MIKTKRLIQLAKKWQRMAAYRRRRITFPRRNAVPGSTEANKGHFVVYSMDKKRFVFPLVYLNNSIFRVLLKMSEEEFGLPSDGPVTLPCDSTFLEYVIALVQGCMPEDLEKALLLSMESCHCSAASSLALGQAHQQTFICGW